MTNSDNFEYVRTPDAAKFDSIGPAGRLSQRLIDGFSDRSNCKVNLSKAPAGAGSKLGSHTHAGEQLFYILNGSIRLQIEMQEFTIEAGSLAIVPAGVSHCWTAGPEGVLQLEYTALLPNPTGELD